MNFTIEILTGESILKPTDYYRYTSIWYLGQSDYVETSSVYGGTATNFFKWMRLDREHGAIGWYGKTVNEVLKTVPIFEFARGNIPKEHQQEETFVEKTQVLKERQLPFGKHKGKTVEWLANNDNSYLKWLVYKTEYFNDTSHEVIQQLL